MEKNLKILFLLIFFLAASSKIALAESLEDLEKELNEIREEISKLTPTKVNNPILSVVGKSGKPITGMIINSSKDNKVVTFIPFGKPNAKPQTGVLLGNSNVKDIAVRQSAEQAAALAAEQARSESAIDKAIIELDQATKFMQESYKKGDVDGAIAALAVLDVVMGDVAKNVPQEFRSEVVKEGKDFSIDQMKEISSITKNINSRKNEDLKELKENIEKATAKGLNVEQVAINIISSGIKTPQLNTYYQETSNLELKRNLSDSIKYSSIIGKSKEKVDLAVRQAAALKSGDPKKFRAVEMEKYGKAAGLSQEMINKGVQAIYNGDVSLEKQISSNIVDKLKSNPNYTTSNADINVLMDESIATEKAAYAILNSGINFSKGTNKIEVKKLANDIEKILEGKVEKSKIAQIKYDITRSTYTITNKENVAANLIAQVNGQQYVDGLMHMNIGSKSIAEQAAVLEANINGNMDAFREVTRSTNKDALGTMSTAEVNKLSSVYGDIIKSQNLSNQIQQDVKVVIGNKAVIETTKALKEASRVSQLAQKNLDQKRAELAKQQLEYKEILAEQKEGRATLGEVLAKQQESSGILKELSEVQIIASEAAKIAGAAAQASGEARAAAKVAAKTASGAVSEATEVASSATSAASEAAQEATSESAAQEVAEVAQEAAQEVAQEVAEVAQEAAQEVAQEVVQEVAKSIDEEIADLVAAEREAWAEYAADGTNWDKHGDYLKALNALSQKQLEKSQANPGCGYPCN